MSVQFFARRTGNNDAPTPSFLLTPNFLPSERFAHRIAFVSLSI